jgi:hypothetical protein
LQARDASLPVAAAFVELADLSLLAGFLVTSNAPANAFSDTRRLATGQSFSTRDTEEATAGLVELSDLGNTRTWPLRGSDAPTNAFTYTRKPLAGQSFGTRDTEEATTGLVELGNLGVWLGCLLSSVGKSSKDGSDENSRAHVVYTGGFGKV